ncbi:hypothetical protein R1sor_011519 [Riccia sorocarpa]|uniref:PGG domain-containing protein n=1 Tax=Riccia sorocarpa TaxID=122646 RepID=A0ABD3I173_9MARC
MAEIQCHHAINSALASFIWDVRLPLGNDHPYRSYTTPSDEKIPGDPQVPPGSDHDGSQVPPGSDNEGSQVPLGSDNENSQVPPGSDNDHEERPEETLRGYVRKRLGFSFFKYLMDITDTRRTAFHDGLIIALRRANLKAIYRPHEVPSPIYNLFVDVHKVDDSTLHSPADDHLRTQFDVCFNTRDGSGRTLFHIFLASDLEIPDPASVYSFELTIWGRFYPRFNWNVLWDYSYYTSRPWYFNQKSWSRDVKSVYEGNGLLGLHGWDVWQRCCSALPLSAEKIVLTSAHISDSERRNRLQWLLDGKRQHLSPTVLFPRFQAQTGVITECKMLTSLQYAVLVGDTATVELLAKDNRIYDPTRIHNESKDDRKDTADALFKAYDPSEHSMEEWDLFIEMYHTLVDFKIESSLHLAAQQGDPEMLRAILDTGKFNPHYEGDGNTILHSAVRCLESIPVSVLMLQDFVDIPKVRTHMFSKLSEADGKDGTTKYVDKRPCQCSVKMEQQKEKALDVESGRQGCVNYLLQVGLDVWQADVHNRIADPGPHASRGYKTWWYDKLVQETQDQKANFGAAANALSVTAALVATASYVGPLQPPLGLNFVDDDQNLKMLVDIVPVRIFIICNNLAFFFALMAIMFSLTPALPMTRESMLEELKRMRRSITLGLIALIISISTILIAFASAIIAVIPNKGSWNHGWLTMSTLVIGGPMCLLVLFLCCIRAVRLLFHNNMAVRRFYKRAVFI